VAVVKPFVTLN